MIDFENVTNIVIPEGEVSVITRGEEILWQKQSKPYKTELAYLESTGTQWIDTEFAPSNNSSVVFDAQITNGDGSLYGVYEADVGYICMRLQGGGFRARYGTRIQRSLLFSGEYERHIFSHKKNVCAVDDTAYSYAAQTFSFSAALVLLGYRSNTTVSELVEAKIYSCQIYDGDTLARDFIPVLDLNDRPCMYDKVSGEFFYNQGTGEFLYGNAV